MVIVPDFLGQWLSKGAAMNDIGGSPWGDMVRTAGQSVVKWGADWLQSKVAGFATGAMGAMLGNLKGIGGSLFQKASSLAGRMFGWGGNQLGALRELVNRESGWNPTAQNPTSTAFGLFQFLDSTWAGTGIRKTTDPVRQIIAGLRYIRKRYGSPLAALSFHNRNNWYDSGGMLQPGKTMAYNATGMPEPVLTQEQWKTAKTSIGFVQKFAEGGTWDPRKHPRNPDTGKFISWLEAARLGIKYVKGNWRDMGGSYNLREYLFKLFNRQDALEILKRYDLDRDSDIREALGTSGSGSGTSGTGTSGSGTTRRERRQQARERRVAFIKALLEGMNRIKPKGVLKIFEEIFDRNIGKKKTKELFRVLKDEISRLNKVFERYQRVAEKLDKARERLENLRQEKASFRESMRDSMIEFGSLAAVGQRTDIFGNELPINATSLSLGLQERLAALQQWAANINRMQQMGFSNSIIKQVIEMGPEQGAIYAKALIAATPQQVEQINQVTAEINQLARDVSKETANELYNAGIEAAKGLIAGLKSRMEELREVARRLARVIVNTIKRELGIRSPSTVAIDLATNFGGTYAKSLSGQAGAVEDAAKQIGEATKNGLGSTVRELAGTTKAVGLVAKQQLGMELNRGLQNAISHAPVGVAPGGAGSVTNVKQEITINTQEIDPRRQGAELGWALMERYRV